MKVKVVQKKLVNYHSPHSSRPRKGWRSLVHYFIYSSSVVSSAVPGLSEGQVLLGSPVFLQHLQQSPLCIQARLDLKEDFLRFPNELQYKVCPVQVFNSLMLQAAEGTPSLHYVLLPLRAPE